MPRQMEGVGWECLDRVIGWCFWTYKRLDTTRCVVSIARPEGWDEIVEFANHPRSTYKEVREARPPVEVAATALDDYLENARLANCTINESYLHALGLPTRPEGDKR